MMKELKILGIALHICSVIIIGLGLWTFSFDETNGLLINKVHKRVGVGGADPGIPFASDTGRVSDYEVEYSYYVNGEKHKGSRIGMGLSHLTLSPFKQMYWEENVPASSSIQVYFSNQYPNVSVLYKGVDWIVALCFSLFGVMCLVSSK